MTVPRSRAQPAIGANKTPMFTERRTRYTRATEPMVTVVLAFKASVDVPNSCSGRSYARRQSITVHRIVDRETRRPRASDSFTRLGVIRGTGTAWEDMRQFERRFTDRTRHRASGTTHRRRRQRRQVEDVGQSVGPSNRQIATRLLSLVPRFLAAASSPPQCLLSATGDRPTV
jgi:hypothetical protein